MRALRRWTNYVFMLSQISCVSKFPNISCLENELRIQQKKGDHKILLPFFSSQQEKSSKAKQHKVASQSLQILQWPVSKDVTLCFNDREYASHDSNGAINKTYLVQNGSFAIQMESLISHLSTFEYLITVLGTAQSK